MAGLDAKQKAIVEMALSALPHEIGCDDCFDHLAAYAEHLRAGTALGDSLQPVKEHLELCAACMEELELLLAAVAELRSS